MARHPNRIPRHSQRVQAMDPDESQSRARKRVCGWKLSLRLRGRARESHRSRQGAKDLSPSDDLRMAEFRDGVFILTAVRQVKKHVRLRWRPLTRAQSASRAHGARKTGGEGAHCQQKQLRRV
ncbi:hypothetical protein FGB62_7g534 [Gracilaria domingensis]|nr:hypothetical protein FGB62_7g534 [Gracilaria domingensis]